MVKIESIFKSFNEHEVLKGVSLTIDKGEILVLIGMSGYGKSVILNPIKVE